MSWPFPYPPMFSSSTIARAMQPCGGALCTPVISVITRRDRCWSKTIQHLSRETPWIYQSHQVTSTTHLPIYLSWDSIIPRRNGRGRKPWVWVTWLNFLSLGKNRRRGKRLVDKKINPLIRKQKNTFAVLYCSFSKSYTLFINYAEGRSHCFQFVVTTSKADISLY